MQDYGLTERITELKGALALVETAIEQHADLPDRLAELRRVVGSPRKSVWAVLTAANAEDYNQFLSEFRLRRAAETLHTVEADIEAGAVHGKPVWRDQICLARTCSGRIDWRMFQQPDQLRRVAQCDARNTCLHSADSGRVVHRMRADRPANRSVTRCGIKDVLWGIQIAF